MTSALLDAYECTGQRAYLARATLLADWVLERLAAPHGGLADRLQTVSSPGLLTEPAPALPESSLMAEALLRLAVFNDDQSYRRRAKELLLSLDGVYRNYGLAAAAYAAAVIRFIEPQVSVTVVGPPEEELTQALLRAALEIKAPLRTVQLLDPDADLEHIVRAGYSTAEGPCAYLCLGATCLPPTSDSTELQRLAAGGEASTSTPAE